jgi:hypothetical protein
MTLPVNTAGGHKGRTLQRPIDPAVPSVVMQGAASAPASYAISVRLDADRHRLEGQETVTYRNTTTRPIPDLVFHLYLNAFKSADTIFMREGGAQHRGFQFNPQENGWIEVHSLRLHDGTRLDLKPLEDGTLARAALPKPVEPGESIRFAVEFTAQLPRVFARTGWAPDAEGDPFYMVGQWFPKLGVWTKAGWNAYPFHANSEFFADFSAYTVQIRLPRGWASAATGLPTGTVDHGDGAQTVTYQANNVIDFAWTASPNLRDSFRKVGAVEIRYVYLPEHDWSVARVLDAAEKSIVDYGRWFGPYPYPRLTVVDVPDAGQGAGGMEYPTLVTAGAMDLLALGAEPVKAGVELSLELVTAHEVAHQWWMGMVATNEAEEPWLDEGFADYATLRLLSAEYGEDTSAFKLGDLRAGYLDLHRGQYVAFANVPIYGKAWELPMYQVSAYSKPALALMTLQRVLGEATMDRLMSTYFQRYSFAHPTTADFRAVAEEVAGQPLGWFFDGLVYGTGTLNYSAAAIDGNTITVQREGELAIPTEIQVTFTNGQRQMVAWDGRGSAGQESVGQEAVGQKANSPLAMKTFTFDRPVSAFTIDPAHKLVIERIWSDNGLARGANVPAWLSVVTRLVYHLQDWLLILGGI